MDAESGAATYHARLSVLEKARTLRLTDAGVSIEPEGGVASVLPYGGITQVRLQFFPTRVQPHRYECLVVTRGLGVKFGNEFYRGIGSFEDRSGDYRRFVAELCRRVATANPAAEFAAGREPWKLGLESGFLVLMVLFLGWILWLTGGPLRWLIWVKLGIVAFFLPTLFRFFKNNRPARFDPGAIPEQVLPAVR